MEACGGYGGNFNVFRYIANFVIPEFVISKFYQVVALLYSPFACMKEKSCSFALLSLRVIVSLLFTLRNQESG